MKSKPKQIPRKDFAIFKKEANRLIALFGLIGYEVYFSFEPLIEGRLASCHVNEEGRSVSLALNSNREGGYHESGGPKAHARHEVFHLLTHRLAWLGANRDACSNEIYEEAEKLTITLTHLLRDV